MWHTELEKIYKNGTLFKQNKPHRNETTVCYCTIYLQERRSQGRLVSRRCRHTKPRSQACLCVNVNKLDLNNTSRCVLPALGLCFTNIEHEAQNAENNVHRHDQTFLFGDQNVRRTLRTGETTHFKSHTSFFKRCCENVAMLLSPVLLTVFI